MKSLIKKVLLKSGTFNLAGQLVRPSVAILRYHSTQENPENFVNSIGFSIIHPRLIFKEQMEIVVRRFKPVTLDEILFFLKEGKDIPRGAVAVTFDDGFADNFENAAPILDYFEIRAAFYVTVNSIDTPKPPWFCRLRHAFWTTPKKEWLDSWEGKNWNLERSRNAAFLFACERCARLIGDAQERVVKEIENMLEVDSLTPNGSIMMSWAQIKKLHQGGHIIGSHTQSHPNLAYVGKEDLARELVESRKVLEEKLSSPVVHFSYPSPILQPHWTEGTVKATEKAGYKTAVTCTSGSVSTSTNPLSLSRIWVPADSVKEHVNSPPLGAS